MSDDDVGRAVKDLLLLSPNVTAMVGSGDDARIYFDTLKQNCVLPAILLTEISSGSEEHLGGALGSGQMRMQIDCCAPSPSKAKELRKYVRHRLQGFRGSSGDIFINNCVHDGGTSRISYAQDGSERHLYTRSVDFLIFHEESIPAR